MAGVRTIGPKRALEKRYNKVGRSPFRGPVASFTPERKVMRFDEPAKRIVSVDTTFG
jgi:hypothetical protein